MDYLAPKDGWAPLTFFAPASEARLAVLGVPELRPATTEEWESVCTAAKSALQRGHEAVLTKPALRGSLTVHADARLINTMARRNDIDGWEIKFVDFAWSGVENRTR